MAKATAPLFAISASGQIGKSIVYDRRGFVRVYAKPSNPKTDQQANIRTPFRGLAAIVKIMHRLPIAQLKEKIDNPSRWGSRLIGEAMGKEMTAWNAAMNEFDAMNDTGKDAWQSAAEEAGALVNPVDYDYAAIDRLAGRAFYAIARVLNHTYGLGPGAPSETNANDWKTYITTN